MYKPIFTMIIFVTYINAYLVICWLLLLLLRLKWSISRLSLTSLDQKRDLRQKIGLIFIYLVSKCICPLIFTQNTNVDKKYIILQKWLCMLYFQLVMKLAEPP